MAVTYGNKPRIVVEESPWGDFFASLPNTVLLSATGKGKR